MQPCSVCNSAAESEENALLQCHQCGVRVHAACYGCTEAGPAAAWYCAPCTAGTAGSSARCVVCKRSGGAMKRAKEAGFAHVTCALFVPGISFTMPETRDLVSLEGLDERRCRLTCVICKEKGGACLQCMHRTCLVAFHASCMYALPPRVSVHLDSTRSIGGDFRPAAFCLKHAASNAQGDWSPQTPGPLQGDSSAAPVAAKSGKSAARPGGSSDASAEPRGRGAANGPAPTGPTRLIGPGVRAWRGVPVGTIAARHGVWAESSVALERGLGVSTRPGAEDATLDPGAVPQFLERYWAGVVAPFFQRLDIRALNVLRFYLERGLGEAGADATSAAARQGARGATLELLQCVGAGPGRKRSGAGADDAAAAAALPSSLPSAAPAAGSEEDRDHRKGEDDDDPGDGAGETRLDRVTRSTVAAVAQVFGGSDSSAGGGLLHGGSALTAPCSWDCCVSDAYCCSADLRPTALEIPAIPEYSPDAGGMLQSQPPGGRAVVADGAHAPLVSVSVLLHHDTRGAAVQLTIPGPSCTPSSATATGGFFERMAQHLIEGPVLALCDSRAPSAPAASLSWRPVDAVESRIPISRTDRARLKGRAAVVPQRLSGRGAAAAAAAPEAGEAAAAGALGPTPGSRVPASPEAGGEEGGPLEGPPLAAAALSTGPPSAPRTGPPSAPREPSVFLHTSNFVDLAEDDAEISLAIAAASAQLASQRASSGLRVAQLLARLAASEEVSDAMGSLELGLDGATQRVLLGAAPFAAAAHTSSSSLPAAALNDCCCTLQQQPDAQPSTSSVPAPSSGDLCRCSSSSGGCAAPSSALLVLPAPPRVAVDDGSEELPWNFPQPTLGGGSGSLSYNGGQGGHGPASRGSGDPGSAEGGIARSPQLEIAAAGARLSRPTRLRRRDRDPQWESVLFDTHRSMLAWRAVSRALERGIRDRAPNFNVRRKQAGDALEGEPRSTGQGDPDDDALEVEEAIPASWLLRVEGRQAPPSSPPSSASASSAPAAAAGASALAGEGSEADGVAAGGLSASPAPAAPEPPPPPAADEDAICAVCLDGRANDDNPIVYCDGCDMGIHRCCYGIAVVPDGDFFCDSCEHVNDVRKRLGRRVAVRDVVCALCPLTGGALKRTADGRWAHVFCAIWTPGCWIGDLAAMAPIEVMPDAAAAARARKLTRLEDVEQVIARAPGHAETLARVCMAAPHHAALLDRRRGAAEKPVAALPLPPGPSRLILKTTAPTAGTAGTTATAGPASVAAVAGAGGREGGPPAGAGAAPLPPAAAPPLNSPMVPVVPQPSLPRCKICSSSWGRLVFCCADAAAGGVAPGKCGGSYHALCAWYAGLCMRVTVPGSAADLAVSASGGCSAELPLTQPPAAAWIYSGGGLGLRFRLYCPSHIPAHLASRSAAVQSALRMRYRTLERPDLRDPTAPLPSMWTAPPQPPPSGKPGAAAASSAAEPLLTKTARSEQRKKQRDPTSRAAAMLATAQAKRVAVRAQRDALLFATIGGGAVAQPLAPSAPLPASVTNIAPLALATLAAPAEVDQFPPGVCNVCFEPSGASRVGEDMLCCGHCGITAHRVCANGRGGAGSSGSAAAVFACDRCRAMRAVVAVAATPGIAEDTAQAPRLAAARALELSFSRGTIGGVPDATQPQCALCCRLGGFMKPTRPPFGWAHIFCALMVPGVCFANPDRMEGPDLRGAERKRFRGPRCRLCTDPGGAVLKCAQPDCPSVHHPMCAARANCYFGWSDTGAGGVEGYAYCGAHGPPSMCYNRVERRWVMMADARGGTCNPPGVGPTGQVPTSQAGSSRGHLAAKGPMGSSPGAGAPSPSAPVHPSLESFPPEFQALVWLRRRMEGARLLVDRVLKREKMKRSLLGATQRAFHAERHAEGDALVPPSLLLEDDGAAVYPPAAVHYLRQLAEDGDSAAVAALEIVDDGVAGRGGERAGSSSSSPLATAGAAPRVVNAAGAASAVPSASPMKMRFRIAAVPGIRGIIACLRPPQPAAGRAPSGLGAAVAGAAAGAGSKRAAASPLGGRGWRDDSDGDDAPLPDYRVLASSSAPKAPLRRVCNDNEGVPSASFPGPPSSDEDGEQDGPAPWRDPAIGALLSTLRRGAREPEEAGQLAPAVCDFDASLLLRPWFKRAVMERVEFPTEARTSRCYPSLPRPLSPVEGALLDVRLSLMYAFIASFDVKQKRRKEVNALNAVLAGNFPARKAVILLALQADRARLGRDGAAAAGALLEAEKKHALALARECVHEPHEAVKHLLALPSEEELPEIYLQAAAEEGPIIDMLEVRRRVHQRLYASVEAFAADVRRVVQTAKQAVTGEGAGQWLGLQSDAEVLRTCLIRATELTEMLGRLSAPQAAGSGARPRPHPLLDATEALVPIPHPVVMALRSSPLLCPVGLALHIRRPRSQPPAIQLRASGGEGVLQAEMGKRKREEAAAAAGPHSPGSSGGGGAWCFPSFTNPPHYESPNSHCDCAMCGERFAVWELGTEVALPMALPDAEQPEELAAGESPTEAGAPSPEGAAASQLQVQGQLQRRPLREPPTWRHYAWWCPGCVHLADSAPLFIGRAVFVFEYTDCTWHAAVIAKWEPVTCRHLVEYADGRWDYLDLATVYVRFDAGSRPPETMPGGLPLAALAAAEAVPLPAQAPPASSVRTEKRG